MAEQLIKKVAILGEESSAEARGLRLKRVRNLANLSRKEFCELSKLNINTLKGWEIGRYGGLPRDGAIRVIESLKEKNIICNIDWLLHGNSSLPEIKNNNLELVISEIELFKKIINQPILSTQILDNSMEPYFLENTYIAGKILDLKNKCEFVNKICIVKFAENILVRKVRESKNKNYFNLFCLNLETDVEPVIADIKLDAVALVERVYREP